MATVVTVKCVVPMASAFDQYERHRSILVSQDRQKASFAGNAVIDHASVLGSTPMRHGQHTWKVKIGTGPDFHMLGVATKPLSPQRQGDHHQAAYCWYSSGGSFYRNSVQVSGRLRVWSANDTFQLVLDCDLHTLQITNMRIRREQHIQQPSSQGVFPVRKPLLPWEQCGVCGIEQATRNSFVSAFHLSRAISSFSSNHCKSTSSVQC